MSGAALIRRSAAFSLPLAAAILLNGIVARSFLWPTDLAPQTVQRGSFQSLAGQVVLALDPDMRRWMPPDVGIYAGGVLAVPTGRSVVLPLASGVAYLVRNAERPVAPYVIIGTRRALRNGERLDHVETAGSEQPQSARRAVEIVSDPRVLAPADGGVALLPWSARPWDADAEWRTALTRRCANADPASGLSVERAGTRIDVRYGSCIVQVAAHSTDADDPVVAVLAGPESATVVKRGGRWQVTPTGTLREQGTALALVTAGTAVGAAAVGGIGALAVAVPLAVLSRWWPFQALLTFVVVTPLAAVVAMVRVARRGRRWPSAAARSLGIVAGLVAFGFTLTQLNIGTRLSEQEDRRFRELCGQGHGAPVPQPPAACLVTGYSMAADMGVGFGVGGTYATLDAECPACAGSTQRTACPGATVTFVRDLLCSPNVPLAPGSRIVFLGGGNDDWMWPEASASRFDQLRAWIAELGIVFDKVQLTSPHEFRPFAFGRGDHAPGAGTVNEAEQLAFDEAAACAERRQARLWLFHDFLASDLASGRSPTRNALVAMRRTAVERHSGRLVDLLDTVRHRAGVSWFNDVIHLSAVGHREIALLACRMMTQSPVEPETRDGTTTPTD
jgi:hypothetical protein